MRPIRLVSGFFTVGIWTLLSRVLGLARDLMMAAFLGAGPVAEAFLVAFSLPNLFRRFFAEGAFNIAFVPLFSKKLEGGEDAQEFARDAFAGLAFIVTVLTVLGVIFMPLLVTAMAAGFRGDARFDLAVIYGRIAFPYIMMISLSALLSGVLNASGYFVAAAAAPVLLNIVFVTAQLALVWMATRRAGYSFKLRRPRMTPELKRLAIIAAPAALAGGVVQINLLVGRQVASVYDGAVAWLSYADRLYQLPLGVVGIAIGIVLLPDLTRRLRAGDEAGGRDAFNRAAEISLALTIPAAIALILVPVPLTAVLFERGQFSADDTAATALAVAVYGMGLPAFVLHKTLQPLYFAREDTKRPFYYALVAMVLNAAIAIGLSPYIGFIAAAVGTTLTGWAMVLQLWLGARGMGAAAQFDDRFKARIGRIVLASCAMGAVLFGMSVVMAPLFGMATVRYAALLVLIVVGGGSYFVFGQLFGAFRIAEFKQAMRRGASKGAET